MSSYIIRRLLLMVPTLIGITAVVFFTMAFSPGGVGASLLSREGELRPEERKALEAYYNKRYGLNKPKVVQYLNWLNQISPVGIKDAGTGFPKSSRVGVKMPDLGESMSRHRPVIDMIRESLPVTLLLDLISIPIVYLIAVYSGIQAAKHRGKMLDVGMGTVLLGLWSVPTIWAGVLMIGFLANREYVHWFPTSGLHDIRAGGMEFMPHWTQAGFERGWLLDTTWHLLLPVICLSYGGFAFLSKLARGAVLDSINQDYIRTARAKGLDEKVVLYHHVLRNSLLPLITVAATILPGVLAGSLIVESIFSVPGMGRLTIEGINARDREVVLATTLLAGLLGLVSFLLADICYAIADPRVSYE
jgi:ABC-type dipeptide/oligopeptide/nickel transport system permease component